MIINMIKRIKAKNNAVAEKLFKRYIAGLRDKEIFFVQVGAFDGVTNDPMFEYIINNDNWRGIFFEPIKRYYEKLCNNYKARTGLIFINKAVDKAAGQTPFYYIEENDDIPERFYWYRQLGTMNKEVIDKICRDFPSFAIYRKESVVFTTTLNLVFREYGVTNVDVVQIDAEGSDFRILKLFFNEGIQPFLIHLEYKHLRNSERVALIMFLCLRGYMFVKDASDITAVKCSLFEKFRFIGIYVKEFFTRS